MERGKVEHGIERHRLIRHGVTQTSEKKMRHAFDEQEKNKEGNQTFKEGNKQGSMRLNTTSSEHSKRRAS